MRALGVIAGMVLVVVGGVLFVRAVMPDLWIQLTEELPQRLAGAIQAEPMAEQPQAEPPAEPLPVMRPGAGWPPPSPAPAREPVAQVRTDGQVGEADVDSLAGRPVTAAGELPAPVVTAGTAAPSDATPDALSLPEDLGTAPRRASGQASPDPEAAGLGTAPPVYSGVGSQARGENVPPDAAATPTAWHPFWKPFRAERSATGFASHVGQATGLPIEVRRTRRGDYLVGFSYGDETELARNIALIEARTGLRVIAEAQR